MSDASPQPADPADSGDLSGGSLGQFHVVRRLGRGAMADVYLAEQRPLKRWVALKILKPKLADDLSALKRFEREAQAAAALVHANIVQIHEVGHCRGLHFIVQEYVQGQNLRDWLARQGLPPLPQALSIMRQVASALAKAAQSGVVHRDIKPENILVTAAGEVKVADFGLARVLSQGQSDVTQVGMTMGTPLYMSPEQIEGRPLDPRSDLYSLGVTCYQMLSGSPPFVGDSPLAVAVQHVRTPPRPLADLRGDLPPALCRVVDRLLAKNPAERVQSAHELLRELGRIYREHCPQASGEDLGLWDLPGPQAPGDPHAAAVRELESAMRSAPSGAGRRWRLGLTAGMAAARLLSGLAAWRVLRPAPLLPSASAATERIVRQPTPVRQWYYASRIGTEEAWQAVIDYFPDKDYYVGRARQQLARIYLREGDYPRAMQHFEELAAAGNANPEFKAFGLAGEGAVLTLQHNYRESAAVLDDLWPIRQELRDVQMRQMLDRVIKENRLKLGPETGQQWTDWLNAQFRPDSPG